MNACALDFPDDTFDVVMDKGTMDSILCGEGSTANVGKLLSEVTRVLKPSGVFFMTSYSTPDNRLSYLENDEYRWKVVVHTVGKCHVLCACECARVCQGAFVLADARRCAAKPTVSATAVDTKDASNVHYIYACCKGAED